MRPAREPHFRLSDEAFALQSAEGTLKPGLFSHVAHLRLAYIHLQRHGLEQAIANMNTQILAFAIQQNVPDNVNRTVTTAAVYTMHSFMQRSTKPGFEALMQEFPQLKTDFKGLLAKHYSGDIFTSREAKAQFLEPDLAPFE